MHGSHRMCEFSFISFDGCSEHTPTIFMKINSELLASLFRYKKSFTRKKEEEMCIEKEINTFHAFNRKN